MIRHDGRAPGDLRPVTIERGFIRKSPGSVLYRCGATTVLVTAQLSDKVPPFLEGKGVGWLTAEYAMLPGSTPTRKSRGPDGRATEIQRLIGRSLRAVVDTQGARPVDDPRRRRRPRGRRRHPHRRDHRRLRRRGRRLAQPLRRPRPAASSATASRPSAPGSSAGVPVLDLDYAEDSTAEVDLNVVRLGGGGLVEVQGTGEAGHLLARPARRSARPGRRRPRPAHRAAAGQPRR